MNDDTPQGPRRGRRALGALVALVLVLAATARHHAFLTTDETLITADWHPVHQYDALVVERAAAEGAPFPFWTPWIQGGTALFAVPTKPFTYPPFVLGVLALGPYLGMGVLLILHVALGAAGTALLARRLGTGALAATLAGLCYALTELPGQGFVAAPFGAGYALAWWPFTTLAWLGVIEGRGVRGAVALAACLALQIHAGGELSTYWLATFLAAFSLPYLFRSFRERRDRARDLSRVAASAALAAVLFAGLAAVTLLPELLWLEGSGRAAELSPEWAREPVFEELHAKLGASSRWVTLGHVVAHVYGDRGWTLLAAIVVGLVPALRRRGGVAVVLGTVAALVLASGVVHDLAFEWLPGYDKMRHPPRFLAVAGWGAILVSAFGFDALVRGLAWSVALVRGPRAARVLRVALPGLAAVALAARIGWETRSLPGLRDDVPALVSAQERLDRATPIYRPALEEPGRFRILHRPMREQPLWLALGIENVCGALGGAGSAVAAYERWVRPGRGVAWQERENRFVLDALNVRFSFMHLRCEDPHEHLELVARPRDFEGDEERMNELLLPRPFVYRRAAPLARASLVDRPVLVVGAPEERERALRAAFDLPGVSARTHVFVESDVDPASLAPEDARGCGAVLFAERRKDDPDVARWSALAPGGRVFRRPGLGTVWSEGAPLDELRVEPLDDARVVKASSRVDVDVTGATGDFLLLSELFALQPGWTATVDGAPAELLRADALVTALRLPPGASRVSFRFEPPGLRTGAWLTALAACACVLLWLAAGRRRPRRGPNRERGGLRGTVTSASSGMPGFVNPHRPAGRLGV